MNRHSRYGTRKTKDRFEMCYIDLTVFVDMGLERLRIIVIEMG